MKQKNSKRLLFGVAIWIVAMFLTHSYIKIALFFVSYLTIGYPVLKKAVRNIFSGNFLDENFLMLVASLGAFLLKEYTEAVAVMLFYGIGEMFEKNAVKKSRASVLELMDLRPDYANKEIDGEIIAVSSEKVNIGDVLVIKPGEKIPLDGKVIFGKTAVDCKSLTGEAVPVSVSENDEVLSGCINLSGVIKIKVIKSFKESTASKILELVETAAVRKAVSEKFITKFARVYTPVVVLCAVLLAVVPVLFGGAFVKWIKRALLFLVVSCPCALVISVPLAFFGAVGGASKKGILIKGGSVIETLSKTKIAVFDKTGTLTKGVFEISKINPNGVSKDELLKCAVVAEAFSDHPIAVSVKNAYSGPIDLSVINKSEEIAGMGTTVETFGDKIFAGNKKFMQMIGLKTEVENEHGTFLHIAKNDNYLGYIVISDTIKEDAKQGVENLKKMGIRKTVMLTGDTENSARKVSKELKIDEVYYNLMPQDKLEIMEKVLKDGTTLYAGDGINDAPVLMRADIGFAMGINGTDAAMEAADVVLMEDKPSKIAEAIKLSKKTMRIVRANVVFALSVKILVMVLGAAGLSNMWFAVFADVGVSVIAISNSIRLLK